MKKTTALALLSIGAILLFAVDVHPWYISLQIVGLVLMLTGIAGLCLGQQDAAWFRQKAELVRYLLEHDADTADHRRVPLNDLLATQETGPHQVTAGRPQALPSAASYDDAPTLPDVWAGSAPPHGPAAAGNLPAAELASADPVRTAAATG